MSDLAWDTLRAVLETTPAGKSFCIDSWRDEAELAQLTSAERGAAHRHAVDLRWLEPLGDDVDGQFEALTRRSQHPAGKGRRVVLFRRTDVGQPAVIAGQGALFT